MKVLIVLLLSTGCAAAQGALVEKYSDLVSAEPFEPARGLLPSSADLSGTVPPPRAQGATATCVSWAVTYGAGSQALRRYGETGAILSPAFTYNQIARDSTCQRSTKVSETLDFLKRTGGVFLSDFAFDEGWCGRQPTPAEREKALAFRIRGWKKVPAKELDYVKAAVSRGSPVIFAMSPGPKFSNLKGDAVFNDDEAPGRGHAMLVVGYDDVKQAFRIQNSSGPDWGVKGYGWIGYAFWRRHVDVGFVIE